MTCPGDMKGIQQDGGFALIVSGGRIKKSGVSLWSDAAEEKSLDVHGAVARRPSPALETACEVFGERRFGRSRCRGAKLSVT
ncbi:MAG: hypothetical protein ACHQT6_00440 [Candidatus Acidiferrales bacterium]